MPDAFLDADQIRASTFIRHCEIHDTLGSTNDRAIEIARELGIELPALVAAREQTDGRGRGKNTWWSSDGALTFSVLLDPSALGISAANWPQLSLATAVAVCDAIASELSPQSAAHHGSPQASGNQESFPQTAIKWPNDVLLDGAKVCGILIESPGGTSPAKDRLIIGVGINVNNALPPADAGITSSAIALCDVTTRRCDPARLLVDFLNALRERSKQLADNDAQLSKAWQKLSWLKEEPVEVHLSEGRSVQGICVGIGPDGALIVNNEFGAQRIVSGSIHSW